MALFLAEQVCSLKILLNAELHEGPNNVLELAEELKPICFCYSVIKIHRRSRPKKARESFRKKAEHSLINQHSFTLPIM